MHNIQIKKFLNSPYKNKQINFTLNFSYHIPGDSCAWQYVYQWSRRTCINSLLTHVHVIQVVHSICVCFLPISWDTVFIRLSFGRLCLPFCCTVHYLLVTCLSACYSSVSLNDLGVCVSVREPNKRSRDVTMRRLYWEEGAWRWRVWQRLMVASVTAVDGDECSGAWRWRVWWRLTVASVAAPDGGESGGAWRWRVGRRLTVTSVVAADGGECDSAWRWRVWRRLTEASKTAPSGGEYGGAWRWRVWRCLTVESVAAPGGGECDDAWWWQVWRRLTVASVAAADGSECDGA